MVLLEYSIIVLGSAMPRKSSLPDLQTQALDVHHFHVVVASPSQHNLPRPSFIHPPTPLLLLSPAPPLRGPCEEEEGEAKLLRAGPECGSVGQAGRPG